MLESLLNIIDLKKILDCHAKPDGKSAMTGLVLFCMDCHEAKASRNDEVEL